MKKVFLRILPLAAAVLLATSCNKDESNGDVVENGQETVVNHEKTITVSGKVNQKSGISKTTVSDLVCTYEGGERIYIYGDGKKIHGESTLTNSNGDFTIDIKYPADDGYVLNGKEVTVEIGVQSAEIIVLKNDKSTKDAVFGKSHATIKIVKDGEDWKIQPDGEGADYNMQAEVAFVKNNKGASITVKKDGDTGDGVTLASGEICVVPAGIKITADGKTKNTTVAGQIYTISPITIGNKPTKEIVWGNDAFTLTATVESGDAVTWACPTSNAVFLNETNEQVTTITGNACRVLVKGTGSVTITATAGGQSDTYTFSVTDEYVDLGTGSVYWATADSENGKEYTFDKQPSGTPSKNVLELLWKSPNVRVSNRKFTNTNGSDASITLPAKYYWSSDDYDGTYAWYVRVDDNGYHEWANGRLWTHTTAVRLVRAQ